MCAHVPSLLAACTSSSAILARAPLRHTPLRHTLLRHTLLGLAVLLGAATVRAETRSVPSDAHPTIQSALDAAAPFDLIKVAPGHYPENLVVTQDSIELRGSRNSVVDGRFLGPCLLVQADAVLITGMTLVNGTEGLRGDGTGLLVQKTRLSGAAGAGVHTTGDFVLLSKLVVETCGGPGILCEAATGANESLLQLCRVSRNQDDGIRLGSLGTFLLDRNTAEGNTGDGLSLTLANGAGPAPAASILFNNTARGNAGAGIRVALDGAAHLERNRCEQNGGHGIVGSAVGASVERSLCRQNAGAGISVTFASGSVTANTCQDNGLAGIDHAFTGGLGSSSVSENATRGNGRDGIRVTGGRTQLRDNNCQRNGGDGIDIDDALTDYTVILNSCSRNGHEGLDNSGVGTLSGGNRLGKNSGLDLAGTGNDGTGDLVPYEFGPDDFDTGGPDQAQQLDL